VSRPQIGTGTHTGAIRTALIVVSAISAVALSSGPNARGAAHVAARALDQAEAAPAWQAGEYRELMPQMSRSPSRVGTRGLTTSVTLSYTAVQRPRVSPGERVALRAEYEVTAPEGSIEVKETRTIRFEGQPVARVERVVSRPPGIAASEYTLTVPLDAAPGWYTVETIVERALSTRALPAPDKATSAFYVQALSAPGPSASGAGDGIRMKLWAERPRYKVGETVKVFFESNKDAYVTLVNVGTSGRITILYPNKFSPSSAVKAGRTYAVPGTGERYRLALRGPSGVELVYALLTATPTRFSEATFTKDAFPTVNPEAEALTRDINRTVKEVPLAEQASAVVEIEVTP